MKNDGSSFQAIGKHSARLKRLRRIVAGEEPGLAALDGIKLIVEAAARGAEMTELYGVPERLKALVQHPSLAPLWRRGRVFAIEDAALERVGPSRSSQGALAVVTIPSRPIDARGAVVFLAGVQDPGNVGSVIRCAAAFGAAGVACSPECADPFSPRSLRASAGHALFLPVMRGADFFGLAAQVDAAGGTVAAAVGRGGIPIAAWRPSFPALIAFGNEGQGLPEPLLARCGVHVTIPVAPEVESLNVAVAAGVALYHLRECLADSAA